MILSEHFVTEIEMIEQWKSRNMILIILLKIQRRNGKPHKNH